MLEEIGLVKIRLVRRGAKKAPFYRVVAADVTASRNGRFIEMLGYYDPMKDPQVVELKEDRVLHWLSTGAVPTDTARSLLRRKGLIKRWREMVSGVEAAETSPGEADKAESGETAASDEA